MAKTNAERQKEYRARKKLQELDMQAPKEAQEEICNELMRQAPASEMEEVACPEGSQDDLPPVTPSEEEPKTEPVLEKPLTDFDVYRRRHAGMFR